MANKWKYIGIAIGAFVGGFLGACNMLYAVTFCLGMLFSCLIPVLVGWDSSTKH